MLASLISSLNLGFGTLIYCIFAVLAGAYLKGYTGFGASMFWVTSLSIVLPPVEVVPMVLLFEVMTSFYLLPSIWRDIRWKSILTLLIGTWIATPLGIYGLSNLPPNPIRIGLAVVVLIAAVLILRGYSLKNEPSQPATVGVGMMAGVLNGSMGIVGPPVILFYFSSPIGMIAGRASIIAFFIGTDSVGAAMFASQGLIGVDVIWRTALFLPALLLGVAIGNRGFIKTDVDTFKKIALYTLIILSAFLAVRALI